MSIVCIQVYIQAKQTNIEIQHPMPPSDKWNYWLSPEKTLVSENSNCACSNNTPYVVKYFILSVFRGANVRLSSRNTQKNVHLSTQPQKRNPKFHLFLFIWQSSDPIKCPWDVARTRLLLVACYSSLPGVLYKHNMTKQEAEVLSACKVQTYDLLHVVTNVEAIFEIYIS